LMFDVQVRHMHRADRRGEALASISGYYRRVTTAARPMNRLVAAVMVGTIAVLIAQIARAERPHWVGWASLALALGPILLAGARTVPNAVRLGARRGSPESQDALAVTIYRDHLACVAAISALLAVE